MIVQQGFYGLYRPQYDKGWNSSGQTNEKLLLWENTIAHCLDSHAVWNTIMDVMLHCNMYTCHWRAPGTCNKRDGRSHKLQEPTQYSSAIVRICPCTNITLDRFPFLSLKIEIKYRKWIQLTPTLRCQNTNQKCRTQEQKGGRSFLPCQYHPHLFC